MTRAKHHDKKPNFPGFLDLLFEITEKVVKYDERFNQLGCGWLVREMTLADR